MKPYLIVYCYLKNGNDYGFGNIPLNDCDGKFYINDIREIENQISELNNANQVAILNIIPLEKEKTVNGNIS